MTRFLVSCFTNTCHTRSLAAINTWDSQTCLKAAPKHSRDEVSTAKLLET